MHIEALHDLYWPLSAGGRGTERQWDRWNKSNALQKLKINIHFQFQAVKGKGKLEVQGIEEMLKTMC